MQRKIFVFCLVLSMVSFIPYLHAQKGKSEVSLAYGYYSIYSLVNLPPYNVSSGVGMINYKYYLSNKVTLGGVIGYENINNWGSYLIFAPDFSYAYYDNKDDRIRVKMYGSGSIGLAVFDDYRYNPQSYNIATVDHSGAKLTGNVTPFGVRIGRKLAGYAEFSLGYKGLISFGASYRFRTKPRAHVDN